MTGQHRRLLADLRDSGGLPQRPLAKRTYCIESRRRVASQRNATTAIRDVQAQSKLVRANQSVVQQAPNERMIHAPNVEAAARAVNYSGNLKSDLPGRPTFPD